MKGCLWAILGYFIVPALIGAGVFVWALYLTGTLDQKPDLSSQWGTYYLVGAVAWFLGATGPHFSARAASPLSSEAVRGIFVAWLVVIAVATVVSAIVLTAVPLASPLNRLCAAGAYILGYLATGFGLEHWRTSDRGVEKGPRVR